MRDQFWLVKKIYDLISRRKSETMQQRTDRIAKEVSEIEEALNTETVAGEFETTHEKHPALMHITDALVLRITILPYQDDTILSLYLTLFNILLKHGANPDQPSDIGWTARRKLKVELARHRTSASEAILSSLASIPNRDERLAKVASLNTFSLFNPHDELNKILTSLDFDQNEFSAPYNGYCAFHWAVQHGNQEMCAFLLRNDYRDLANVSNERVQAMEFAWKKQSFGLVVALMIKDNSHSFEKKDRIMFINKHLLLHWTADNNIALLELILSKYSKEDIDLDKLNEWYLHFIEILVRSKHPIEKKLAVMAHACKTQYHPSYLAASIKAICHMNGMQQTSADLSTLTAILKFFDGSQDLTEAMHYVLNGKNALTWAMFYECSTYVKMLLRHLPALQLEHPVIQSTITEVKRNPCLGHELKSIINYFVDKKIKGDKETDTRKQKMIDFIQLLLHTVKNSHMYKPPLFTKGLFAGEPSYKTLQKSIVDLYTASNNSPERISLFIMCQGLLALLDNQALFLETIEGRERKSATTLLLNEIKIQFHKAEDAWEKRPGGYLHSLFDYFLEEYSHTAHPAEREQKFIDFIKILNHIGNKMPLTPKDHAPTAEGKKYATLKQDVLMLLGTEDGPAEMKRMYDAFVPMLKALSTTQDAQGVKSELAAKILSEIQPESVSADTTITLAQTQTAEGRARSGSDSSDQRARDFARATAACRFMEKLPHSSPKATQSLAARESVLENDSPFGIALNLKL